MNFTQWHFGVAMLATLFLGASLSMAKTPLSEPIYLWHEQPLVSPDREIIKDQRVYYVDNPAMVPFLPEKTLANGAAVVIFPGGGYVRLAINHEGYDIAKWFAAQGVAAFVVKYRMQEHGFPAPLLDAQRAVRLIKHRANEYGIDPQKVGVVGFSAGGHVAASVTTRHDFVGLADDIYGHLSARPAFAVLGYPVITMQGNDAHQGSKKALLGESPSAALVQENSLETQVKADVPPVFMMHGVGDQSVPVSNSLAFFAEVQAFNKRSELHIYQTHIHGVGMIQGQGSVSLWPQALTAWLQGIEILPSSSKTTNTN